MGTHGSNDVGYVLIDGYDVRGYLTTITDEREALTEDTTVLGDDWGRNDATGIKQFTMSQEGFFDDAAGAIHDALVDHTGAPGVVMLAYAGNVAGARFVGAAGPLQEKYSRIAKMGELHKAKAEYVAGGASDEGIILYPLGAVTADGDTTAAAHDDGAASADGAAVYLSVTALTLDGASGVTISVQDSADNTVFTELAAFTAVAAAPAAERKAVTGTVNRYLAVAWDFTGTPGAGASVTFTVGVARF